MPNVKIFGKDFNDSIHSKPIKVVNMPAIFCRVTHSRISISLCNKELN